MKRCIAAATLALALLGCGIGSSDTVEELRPDELAAPDQTSTTSTTVPDSTEPLESSPGSIVPTTLGPEPTTTVPTDDVTLYFIDGSQLVPVPTALPVGVRARGILNALAVGPPPDEFEAGIRNAVPTGLVRGTRQSGHRIAVDFNSEAF